MPTTAARQTASCPELLSLAGLDAELEAVVGLSSAVAGFVASTWTSPTAIVADIAYDVDEKEHWDIIFSESIGSLVGR